jgi:hypothetical protein
MAWLGACSLRLRAVSPCGVRTPDAHEGTKPLDVIGVWTLGLHVASLGSGKRAWGRLDAF